MATLYLDRPEGRIAYDDTGEPGNSSLQRPAWETCGASTDTSPQHSSAPASASCPWIYAVRENPRSAGASTSTRGFASDYLALIDELGGPAVLIGNSKSCSSAVIAATEAPDKVSGIALLGPFKRPVATKWWQKAMFAAVLAPPWGGMAWVSYYSKSLYPGPKPEDLAAHARVLSAGFAEKGRMAAFRKLAADDHAESGRRLGDVTQPALVVMGTADPDFPDAVAEAKEVAAILGAELLLVEGCGHYPQADSPQTVAPAIIDLVRRAGA